MSSLRLKATGERLVWWRCDSDDGFYLSRESAVGDKRRWFAGTSPHGYGSYNTDVWLGGGLLLERSRHGTEEGYVAEKLLCEQALISAGIAEEEEPFPSD